MKTALAISPRCFALILIALLLPPACGFTDPKHDVSATLIRPSAQAQALFQTVQTVLANRCVNCHGDFGSMSDNDFVSRGYVTPGIAEASLLYGSLLPNGGSMPKSGTISMRETQAIGDWIRALN